MRGNWDEQKKKKDKSIEKSQRKWLQDSRSATPLGEPPSQCDLVPCRTMVGSSTLWRLSVCGDPTWAGATCFAPAPWRERVHVTSCDTFFRGACDWWILVTGDPTFLKHDSECHEQLRCAKNPTSCILRGMFGLHKVGWSTWVNLMWCVTLQFLCFNDQVPSLLLVLRKIFECLGWVVCSFSRFLTDKRAWCITYCNNRCMSNKSSRKHSLHWSPMFRIIHVFPTTFASAWSLSYI